MSEFATIDRPGLPDQSPEMVTEDGYLYNADGEVIGFDPSLAVPGNAPPERFVVRDRDGADWVLEKISFLEAGILALEARKKATIANFDRMIGWLRKQLEWLTCRFSPELEAQARRELEGSKRKTVVYPHGQISFRASKGSVEITSPHDAALFAAEWAPEQTKVSVGVTGLTAAIAAYRTANDEEPDTSGFAKFHGPSEKVSIKTGIGKDAD